MPGWNKKTGGVLGQTVSEDEFWSMFNFVFSDSCHKTNTYKYGLIKSICDHVYELKKENDIFFISYEKLFSKFAENYWNLVTKYKLRQMKNNGKSEYSRIETIFAQAIEKYEIPENIAFQSLRTEERDYITREVTKDCKKCVVGALCNDFEDKLYFYDLRGNGLFLNNSAYQFISRYKNQIEKLNYYSWARFLEKINDIDKLYKILDKLDEATPKRKDLSIYRDILLKELQGNRCFYCGNEFARKIEVDHLIPWSFVKTDNLWNFVLSCPHCNNVKSDGLVDIKYINAIERRNAIIIANYRKSINSLFIESEFQSYSEGIIYRMWEYAKMNGYRPCYLGIEKHG